MSSLFLGASKCMVLRLAELLDGPLAPSHRDAAPVPFDCPILPGQPRNALNSPPHRPGDLQMSLPKWCALLVANVLKTRTPFASYLSRSISLSQGGRSTLAPTFFPVPVPYLGAFHGMPAGLSSSKRRLIHLKRAVHTICMGLNFWHSGGTFEEESLLQREPNRLHRCLFGRLVSLIRSDGLSCFLFYEEDGSKTPEFDCKVE